MDFDDEHATRRGLEPEVSVPPEDWAVYTRPVASVEAIYNAHQPALARYLRRRAPKQDLGDLVQECFRRLAMAKGGKLALIEKPGAYLVSTARNLLTDRARADTRSEEHPSELQSLMRISYSVLCLQKKNNTHT